MNYRQQLEYIYNKSLHDERLTEEEALFIINTSDEELDTLLEFSNQLKLEKVGREVILCGIVNAKSGRCSEDCSFCAQSAHHKTAAPNYPLLSKDQMVGAAVKAKDQGVGCFSVVTAGKGVRDGAEFQEISAAIEAIESLNKCASLGIVTLEQLIKLKASGLNKYHHNLETAESFFSQFCTTHTYKERVQTIKMAKQAGLEVCSGGIFGLGETPAQRVELGLALRDLNVDSVPINILNPIEGTRVFSSVKPIRVEDILKLIATFRFIMPDKIIGVFGGREYHLKDKQPLLFPAGANAILLGNYLTTEGSPAEMDLQMIKNAGLIPKAEAC